MSERGRQGRPATPRSASEPLLGDSSSGSAGAGDPFSFGSSDRLDGEALRGAAIRSYPRPSLLAEPLTAGKQAAKGLAALGIETHGDLIEHLPHTHRDRREVRGVAAIGVGEEATIAVTVRGRHASGRCATGAARRSRRRCSTRPGRRSRSGGTSPGSPASSGRGRRCCCTGARSGATSSGSTSTSCSARAARRSIRSAWCRSIRPPPASRPRRCATLVWKDYKLIRHVVEPLPAALRVAERAARPLGGGRRGALPRRRGRGRRGTPPARLRGAVPAPARRHRAPPCPARGAAGGPAAGDGEIVGPLAGAAAVRADRRPAARLRGDRRRPRGRAPDAAPADGRGRQRQDGGRPARDAARRRERPPGRADGADRDARRAAPRDDRRPARRHGAGRAADRLDDRRRAGATCSRGWRPASWRSSSGPTR